MPPPVRTLPISVCLIVRDEEALLPEALASVKAFAREIVVVDTGSTDRTVAIAASFGARVLSFTWVDDFSAARNVYLEAATSDWILSLDADQRVDPRALPALAEAVRRPQKAQVVRISLVDNVPGYPELGSYTGLRLFRRDPRIRYSGRVHEDVSPSLGAIGSHDWPDARVTLIDIGYADPAERERKRLRNLSLLERSLAEQPDDLFLAWKLAQTMPTERASERRALRQATLARASALSPRARAELPFLPPLLAACVADLTAAGDLVGAAALAPPLARELGGTTRFTAGVALARVGDVVAAREHLTRYRAEASRVARANVAVHPDPDASPAAAALWLADLARQSREPEALAQADATLAEALATAVGPDRRRAPHPVRPDDTRSSDPSAPLRLALGCERVRLLLAARKVADAARALDALAATPPAGCSLQPLLLVSAEVALASGDAATARALAESAVQPADDRAAALLATLDLMTRGTPPARLEAHLARVPGLRHETLAVRAAICQRLGEPLAVALPEASRARAERLAKVP